MSDNEAEVDVSFLPGPGQGGTSKRAVYEPDNAQRCKQVVCSRNWAVAIVAFFSLLVLTIAVIAAFARPSQRPCMKVADDGTGPSPSPTVPGPPVATNGQPFPWQDIRLPETIHPLNYDLFMHPNLTTFKFLGTVSIELQVRKVTNFIVLHAKGLNISNYEVIDFHSNRNISVTQMLEYPKHEQVYFQLKKDLSPSKRYTLILTFHGELSDLMAGFYRSSYKNSQGQTRYLATTQFEATDARRAFPCFDEPSLKATFTLTMVREPGHLSLFNMPLVKTEDFSSDGLKQDKFETSVKMSTYLVAFIVCDFTYIQNTTSRGTRVSVYAPKNQIQQAEFALEAAVTILEYYELFFGIPYPLPKQDLIAIPDFAPGAMENWGLITYRMTALLYDPAVSTEEDKKRVAIVIAHELAHQWFGNLVTMEWWNDLWLNEGFASFVEYIGADRVNPDWHMMDQFVAETLVGALYKDSLSNSHPVSVPVNDPSEISEIFDAISYNKGASIIRMLEALISRGALQAGLKNYLSKFKYGNARTDDLWQALSESLAQDMPSQKGEAVHIKEFMDRYTVQMGYPVVMVSRRGTAVVAQQQQFLLHSNVGPVLQSPFENKWHIPLTFVTDENPASSSGILWMREQSLKFEVPQDIGWIKMNVNFTGYYRVHYDENNWKALTQQLKDNHMVFSVADRAELLDDSFALARSGLMSATTALSLAEYLKRELMYFPWSVALGNLEDIAFLLEGTAAYDNFVTYYHELMDDVLNELGMGETKSTLERDLRGHLFVMAVKYNKQEWVAKAIKIFQDWMENDIPVKPEFKLAVYRAGIQYGREKEWDFVWSQYKQTDVPSEKRHLLGALSTTTDANKLPRLLEMSLEEDKIRKQDTVSLVAHIASTTTGRVLAWNFLKQQWPEFKHRYGDGAFEMSTLISSVSGGFKTQHDYDDVKSFFEKNPVPSAKRAVAQSLERIEMNRDWIKINQKVVTKWLDESVQKTTEWR